MHVLYLYYIWRGYGLRPFSLIRTYSNIRQYLCAAGILCSRPRGTYWLRRQSANTCHRHRQIVLCSTTSDSERPALSSTTCPADTNPCFGCQEGRLLLFHAVQCLRSSTGQATCSPSSTLPPDSCSQPGAPNASPRFSATFIGSRSRSLEMSPFGRAHMTFYWHSVVIMALSSVVSEIFNV